MGTKEPMVPKASVRSSSILSSCEYRFAVDLRKGLRTKVEKYAMQVTLEVFPSPLLHHIQFRIKCNWFQW